jgi:hypothetical protein
MQPNPVQTLALRLQGRIDGFDFNLISRATMDWLAQRPSAEVVAQVWKIVIDADSKRSRADPAFRTFVLVMLCCGFETVRLRDYAGLRDSLGRLRTISGSPLSVIGTRCEMMSRAAEALFLAGRRDPGDSLCFAMLEAAVYLFDIALTECRQKDDPKHAKRWYGIRGVCRLMVTVQSEHNLTVEEQRGSF